MEIPKKGPETKLIELLVSGTARDYRRQVLNNMDMVFPILVVFNNRCIVLMDNTSLKGVYVLPSELTMCVKIDGQFHIGNWKEVLELIDNNM